MNNFILLLPSTIFPYSLLIGLFCFLKGAGSIGEVFGFLPRLFVLSPLCSIGFLAVSILKKLDSRKIAFYNMAVKLIQIPAYVLIFALGVLSFGTLFTMGISVVLLIFDCLSVLLTGLIGIAAVVRCCADGKISKGFSIWNGLLQFVFCVDIVSAVIVFVKSRSDHSLNCAEQT